MRISAAIAAPHAVMQRCARLLAVAAALVLAAACTSANGRASGGPPPPGERLALDVPRDAGPGEMAVLELTLAAPGGVVEVLDEEGGLLGVVRPFGPDAPSTHTVALPDVAPGAEEVVVYVRESAPAASAGAPRPAAVSSAEIAIIPVAP